MDVVHDLETAGGLFLALSWHPNSRLEVLKNPATFTVQESRDESYIFVHRGYSLLQEGEENEVRRITIDEW